MSGTVLIIDDDVEVTRTFAGWLRLEGFSVRTAPDGEAGLRAVCGVDAIVLDARMPLLDGLGFLRRIRLRGDRMPVAIVTGDYLIEETVLEELKRLDARIVYKPLWLDDLMTLVKGLMARTVPA
jgi:DNA-binding response OmpR family regulator